MGAQPVVLRTLFGIMPRRSSCGQLRIPSATKIHRQYQPRSHLGLELTDIWLTSVCAFILFLGPVTYDCLRQPCKQQQELSQRRYMDDYLTLQAQEAGPAGPSQNHGGKCAPTLSRQRGRRGQVCNCPHDCPDRPSYSSCQPATASKVTAVANLPRRDDAQRPRTKSLGPPKTGLGPESQLLPPFTRAWTNLFTLTFRALGRNHIVSTTVQSLSMLYFN